LVACAAACTALFFFMRERGLLGHIFFLVIIVSLLFAISEFFLKMRLLSQEGSDLYRAASELVTSVRARGLSLDPLFFSLYNVVAIPLVLLTWWRRLVKVSVIGILIVAIFAAGARAASIAAMLLAVLGLLSINTPRSQLDLSIQRKILLLVGVGILAPALWF